ncbi:hypothetical protein J15TS10_00830 [Paenibacillus woosongensis]|uniref:Uncharacterized protein n=2 Tax=Paenibacillus woosongensis TaxID=307580 RepID=A0ABQ4MJV8_9BACL|nr:hypothetical protein J15TS10_00830 [Paenibacillus woosongensis]
MNVKGCQKLVVLLVALLLLGFQSPVYGEKSMMKATWIWQTDMIMDGGEQILRFSRNEGINLIYLQINRQMPKETYEAFVKRAHEAQIAVHALGGDPRWALVEYRDDMLGLADWVMDYNGSVTPEGRFDGVHLDIEPYVLDQWESGPDEIISSWESNLKAFLSKLSGSGLERGIDIPFWFDHFTLENGTSLNEWLISTFDHVTIMAYRNQVDSENGIISLSQDELELASKLGKKLLIAVNTKEMPQQAYTTFHGHSKEQMEQTLQLLSSSLSSHTSFAGLAIHDMRNWKNIYQDSSEDDTVPDGEEPSKPVPDPTPDPDPGQEPEPEPEPQPEPGTEPEPEPIDVVPDAQPVQRDEVVRGTYIWESGEVIRNSQDILEFAMEKQLNWLYVRLDLQQPFSAYSSFIKQAAAAGIEVHALGGTPTWAMEYELPRMMRLVNYVKDYNRAVEPDERFHGIHLDIEPYVLPEWRMDPQQIISEWTSNLDAFVTELRKDSNLEASMDLAVWLDKYKVTGEDISLSKWMIDRMDHVALMAFRDSAEGSNGIVDVTKEEIAFAEELGKPIYISVEIKASHEGNHITFFEEGAAYMEEELAKLKGLLKHTSFKGTLVHAYTYWKNAKP